MGENFFATSPDKQTPWENSNASSTDFFFESPMVEVPRRASNPFRSTAEIDTDEPLTSSQFAVYDDSFDSWKQRTDSVKRERLELHKHITNQLQELRDAEDKFEKNSADIYKRVEEDYVQMSEDLARQQESLAEEQNIYKQEEEIMEKVRKLQREKVTLDVGGKIFVTSLTTLTRDPSSVLAIKLRTEEPEADGSYFLDRDGTHFRLILNYLRDLKIPQQAYDDPNIMSELMREAEYYRINDLLKLRWTGLPTITQEELYKQYPVPTSNKQPTLFKLQRKNLAKLDFSRYHIDTGSDFSGSNLESCNFLNATFVFDFNNKINFSNAYLHDVKFPKPDGRELVAEFDTTDAVLDSCHQSN